MVLTNDVSIVGSVRALKSQKHPLELTKLMKIIGDPLDNDSKAPIKEDDNIIKILHKAIRNKVPLLFFQKLPSNQTERFCAYYRHYCRRRNSSIHLITDIAHLLEENEIDYTFFKTLKPFRSIEALQ